ncbi:hypothetical protein G6F35_019195 [Rhizopus arrhizus]|nr:hypothetical protein G6F35_019195 [Rhizopus arrhizus]
MRHGLIDLLDAHALLGRRRGDLAHQRCAGGGRFQHAAHRGAGLLDTLAATRHRLRRGFAQAVIGGARV